MTVEGYVILAGIAGIAALIWVDYRDQKFVREEVAAHIRSRPHIAQRQALTKNFWERIDQTEMPEIRANKERLYEMMSDSMYLVCPFTMKSGLEGIIMGCKVFLKK